MKQWYFFLSVLLVLVLLLTACAVEDKPGGDADKRQDPKETAGDSLPSPVAPDGDPDGPGLPAESAEGLPSETVPVRDTEDVPGTVDSDVLSPDAPISSAFARFFTSCPDSVSAVLVNAPFPNGRPESTVVWNEGEYDQLVLIPRYVGSKVNAFRLTFGPNGEPQMEETPSYTALSEDGTAIVASLDRPEGFPAWYVEIVTPDGERSGLTLEYNGRTGTPPYEFICTEPALPDGFTEDVSAAQILPLSKTELSAFVLSAQSSGMDAWEAARQYFSQVMDIGDRADFTLSYGHEMDGNTYSFRMARMHQNYVIEAYGLDELVTGQYSIYEQLGNELGILGPEFRGELPDLTWQLTGLTVFNKLLAAREIRVAVNGEEVGTYVLSQDTFCTLIPLDLPEQLADKPVDVEITVLSTWFGDPAGAWIDAYGGLVSNISGAR